MNYIILNKQLCKTYGFLEGLILGYKFLEPKASKKTISEELVISRKEFSRLSEKSNFLCYQFPTNFSKLPHWRISLEDIKTIGKKESLLLTHLKDLYYMFQCEFFQKQEKIAEQLPLTVNEIRSATKNLVDLEYLFVERKGYNKNNYYTINPTQTKLEGNKVKETRIFERIEDLKAKNMKNHDKKSKQHLSLQEIEPVLETSLLDIFNEIENYQIDILDFYKTKDKYRNPNLDKINKEFNPRTKASDNFFILCNN